MQNVYSWQRMSEQILVWCSWTDSSLMFLLWRLTSLIDFKYCFVLTLVLVLDCFWYGIWKERENLESDKLKQLADTLPAFVLCSRAPSTNSEYEGAWLGWKKWEMVNTGCHKFPVSSCAYIWGKNLNHVSRRRQLRQQFMALSGPMTRWVLHPPRRT